MSKKADLRDLEDRMVCSAKGDGVCTSENENEHSDMQSWSSQPAKVHSEHQNREHFC